MVATFEFDLVGIGRAFTDIVSNVDERFLRANGLPKGRGVDVSTSELIRIRSELEKFTFEPGGSASNTVAGVAALGGRAAFIGKVCDDAAGRSFRNAFRQSSVFFPSGNFPAEPGAISATCLVLMTKDGSVTIVNNRGVADKITRADIDHGIITSSCTLFIAGEMLASPDSRDATEFAIQTALRANRKVALNLNNLYLDDSNKFLRLADFLFGNRYEFDHNFPGREIASLQHAEFICVITDGAEGAHIAGRGTYIHIAAVDLIPSVETAVPSYVGAGDQFAAGFLFGFARGASFEACGRLGAETAAAVMRASGARPSGDWTGLAAKYIEG